MVTPVDKPHSTPIFVALDQVRHCPDDLTPDQSWPSWGQVKEHSTDTVPDSISDDENVESLFEVMAPTQVYSFSWGG